MGNVFCPHVCSNSGFILLIRGKDFAIISDRIFDENPSLEKELCVKEIRRLLGIKKVIIIPQFPDEMTGHADGVVRLKDDKTVIICAFHPGDSAYKNELKMILMQSNLDVMELPISETFYDTNNWEAYINYLEVGDLILVPQLGCIDDLKVLEFFQNIFEDKCIEAVDVRPIVKDGGALNCISWNVKKK